MLMYLCLGDIIRMGGCFESTTGEVHFVTTPSLFLWHHFWRPFLLHLLMQCASKGFLCLLDCRESAKYRVWSVAGISRSAATYRACFWLRGETMVWMCGRMERRGVGNGDEGRAVAFILGKLISPFVHLSIR